MTDQAIIEAAARALRLCGKGDSYYDEARQGVLTADYSEKLAEDVLAAVTPRIEAAAQKESAEALMEQWLSNHAEHCGKQVPPWPHDGMCHWPMPEILIRLQALKP